MENENIDNFTDDILTKKLIITRNGRYAIWLDTYNNSKDMYGFSNSICSPKGYLTRILDTIKSENKIQKLVKVYPSCMYVQAKKDKEKTIVQIFKVSKIDTQNRKIILKKVATFNNKWDTTEYIKKYKKVVKSTSMRAKKAF